MRGGFSPHAQAAYSAQPSQICVESRRLRWGHYFLPGAHANHLKWVLRREKLDGLCLKMERNWKAKASRLPKWVWRINLCCPNFYSLFLEMISKFPSIPFAVCSYFPLLPLCLSELLVHEPWANVHLTPPILWRIQPRVWKWHPWKKASIKPSVACLGIYRWKWDRRGWRKKGAGMVIWAWESKKNAEELCQEPQEGTEPRNDWAEECLVLGP